MSPPQVGLVLGSGSARGWAHIGVIRALEEAGIKPDIVCGASVGAFVGAAYAEGELDELESWVRALTVRNVLGFFDVGFSGGLIKGEKLLTFFTERFVDGDFASLSVPFACVATDLATGREVWLREGSVAEAVRASIALPGLFAPHARNAHLLVDGGLVNPVPVSLCRAMGAEIVIAIDLGSELVGRRQRQRRLEIAARPPRWTSRLRSLLGRAGGEAGGPPTPSMVDVLASSINIMQVRIARSRLAGEPADLLVAPRLGGLGPLDYHRGQEAIEEGADAMRMMLPQLQRLLEDT